MRKYVMTGRGSITRWEHEDGRPVGLGTIPPDAILVRHEAKENPEIIVSDDFAKNPSNAHFKLRPMIAGSVTTETAPPAPPAPAPKAAKAAKSSEASASSNIG